MLGGLIMNNVLEFPKSDKYLLSVIITDLKDRLTHLESFFPEKGYEDGDTFRAGWVNAYYEEANWLNSLIEELEKNL
jgi:hypothetical protein